MLSPTQAIFWILDFIAGKEGKRTATFDVSFSLQPPTSIPIIRNTIVNFDTTL